MSGPCPQCRWRLHSGKQSQPATVGGEQFHNCPSPLSPNGFARSNVDEFAADPDLITISPDTFAYDIFPPQFTRNLDRRFVLTSYAMLSPHRFNLNREEYNCRVE